MSEFTSLFGGNRKNEPETLLGRLMASAVERWRALISKKTTTSDTNELVDTPQAERHHSVFGDISGPFLRTQRPKFRADTPKIRMIDEGRAEWPRFGVAPTAPETDHLDPASDHILPQSEHHESIPGRITLINAPRRQSIQPAGDHPSNPDPTSLLKEHITSSNRISLIRKEPGLHQPSGPSFGPTGTESGPFFTK